MEFLQSILENNSLPIVSALILGLMTAISPCPLATNITATAYISKNITNKKKVFISGLLYALGRAFSYTVLGVVLFFGASKFEIALFFNQNGEKFLGPLLIIIGLIMLNVIKLNFLGNINVTEKLTEKFKSKGLLGSFLIGVIFALAFCPYSGALFFGMLIPMTISSASGLYLPVVFAIATGIPVIIFAWLLAYTVSGVGKLYNHLKTFEFWFRKFIAVVFIGIGAYYVIVIYL